jgi:hypothetical protein
MNKKIKVIELLNKKANNEQMPSKIRFEGLNYQYKGSSYYDRNGDLLCENCDLLCVLDSEVEILEDEEETGISKLEKEKVLEENPAEFRYDLRYYYDKEKMGDKINEIIKKVNELDKKINKEE